MPRTRRAMAGGLQTRAASSVSPFPTALERKDLPELRQGPKGGRSSGWRWQPLDFCPDAHPGTGTLVARGTPELPLPGGSSVQVLGSFRVKSNFPTLRFGMKIRGKFKCQV